MTKPTTGSLVALALVLVAGCKGNAPPAPTQAPLAKEAVAAAATDAPPAVAQAAPATAPAAKKVRPCPTSIAGAAGTAADTRDGIALTVTAREDAAAQEIRASARALAASSSGNNGGRRGGGGGGDGSGGGGGGGDGSGGGGGGGGGLGKCPVVVRATTLDVQDIAGGALLTMRPASPDALATLRKEVRERLSKVD